MKHLTICFFGTYDRDYSRNQILLKGLVACGVTVVAVHTQLTPMKLTSSSHLSVVAILHRIIRKVAFLPVVLTSLSKIKKSDILLCAYPGHLEMPLAWIVAKLLRKPLIFDPLISLTDTFTDDFGILQTTSLFAQLLRRYEQFIFNLADIVLADTPYRKDNYAEVFGIQGSKIVVVPLGADNSIYQKVAKKKNKQQCLVVYYGLYNPVHGVEYMIEAANILRGEKNLEFLFIGDGQTYPAAKALTEKLGVTNIQFLQLVESEALPYLQTADIFLGLFAKSQTVYRTIPNKVLQGMALGVAVISEDGIAIQSAFTVGKQLFVCPSADSRALARVIKRLKEDTKLRETVAEAGFAIYTKKFTPIAIATELVKTAQMLQEAASSKDL